MKEKIFFLSVLLGVTACGSRPASNLAEIEANAAKTAQPSPAPALETLTSESVVTAFKDAKFPLTNIEIYTEETDANHLLGRPHQYVGKINWADSRVKGDFEKNPNTIEVFLNAEDLEARKKYVEAISKASPMFNQYIYEHKNILLRLTHRLLPKDAAQYESILKSL